MPWLNNRISFHLAVGVFLASVSLEFVTQGDVSCWAAVCTGVSFFCGAGGAAVEVARWCEF